MKTHIPHTAAAERIVERVMVVVILIAFAFAVAFTCHAVFIKPGNNIHSFCEPYFSLPDGWTLTDSSGADMSLHLPYTISYGKDGEYTLSYSFPADKNFLSENTTLQFYSNYIDFYVTLGDDTIYTYPYETTNCCNGTGNTWHYIKLSDYNGKTIQIHISCQLGNSITYLIEPPLIGSKSAMLYDAFMSSTVPLIIASNMLILSLTLFAFYISLRKRLSLDNSTLYLALFSLMFSLYVYLESMIVKQVVPSGYAVYVATLQMIALLPMPLICLFACDLDSARRPLAAASLIVCTVNYCAQTALHVCGVCTYRAMLPFTHTAIIISIVLMTIAMLLSKNGNRAHLRLRLLSATPMIIGICLDITLIWLEKPSFDNSLWFLVGVTIFIVIQFVDFIRSYFTMHRTVIESDVLLKMAYSDSLSGLKNRNAYERRLAELKNCAEPTKIGCLVIDINELKHINDADGHAMGDTAIRETAAVISDLLQSNETCYRTGGDEFSVIILPATSERVNTLSKQIAANVSERGKQLKIRLTVAVGCGTYSEKTDVDLHSFVSRVDTLMYEIKKKYKQQRSSNP